MEQEVIRRIEQMEACFDALLEGVQEEPPAVDSGLLEKLMAYYDGGQWLRDFALDEQGLLPPELKRGVLSEDGVYNLLTQIGERKDGK